jgi:inner membrane protein
MSPITHFMVGWVCLERLVPARRDKALVALAGVAPDLDGIGIVIDFATRMLGWAETNYYQEFHRMYGHGLPAALAIAVIAGALATRRLRVALLAFVSVHLHFLCDLLGSRGNGTDDIWGIYYWAPVSNAHELAWTGQWPLVGWQNMLISVVLLGIILARAVRLGYSPVGLVSGNADAALLAILRQWKTRLLSIFTRGK